jgi:hypothetical protein
MAARAIIQPKCQRAAKAAKSKTNHGRSRICSSPLAGCIVRWEKQVQFLRPRQESFCRALDLLLIVCAFKPMQHLVPSIHAGTRLVLAQQRNRIGYGANGASIPDVELALEEKLGGVPHARGNLGRAHWFRLVSGAASSAIPPPLQGEVYGGPLQWSR